MKTKNNLSKLRILFLILISNGLIFGLSFPRQSSLAQAASNWSTPVSISGNNWYSMYPLLVSGYADRVLGLWTCTSLDTTGNYSGICLSELSQNHWSDAVDVVALSDQTGGILDATVVDGTVHLVGRTGWQAFAPLEDASSARNWSIPDVFAQTSLNSAIKVDPSGTLHLIYAESANNIFYVNSPDKGQSWSVPLQISDCGAGRATDWPRLAIGPEGTLYASWTEFSAEKSYSYDGVYFSRSVNGGRTWELPLEISRGNFGDITVVSYKDQVHLLWNAGISGMGRFHQISLDKGQTWSDPEEVAAGLGGGMTGFPNTAVDSRGNLHTVTSTCYLGRCGVFYTSWNGRRWSKPIFISPGVVGDAVESPYIEISGGNHLHVLFQDGSGKVWYTSAQTDAPEIRPPLTSTPEGNETVAAPTTTIIHPATQEPVSTPTFDTGAKTKSLLSTPTGVLLVSVGPVSLFVMLFIVGTILKRKA